MRQREQIHRLQSVLLRLCGGFLGLALVGALVACGGAPPADTPPPAADLLSVVVTEQLAVPPPQPAQKVVFSQAFSDQQTITTIQAALLTIPLTKPNVPYTCPADVTPHDAYDLRFTEKGKLVERASVDATDCGDWTITTERGLVRRHLAPDSFWDSLHSATGAPLPLNDYS